MWRRLAGLERDAVQAVERLALQQFPELGRRMAVRAAGEVLLATVGRDERALAAAARSMLDAFQEIAKFKPEDAQAYLQGFFSAGTPSAAAAAAVAPAGVDPDAGLPADVRGARAKKCYAPFPRTHACITLWQVRAEGVEARRSRALAAMLADEAEYLRRLEDGYVCEDLGGKTKQKNNNNNKIKTNREWSGGGHDISAALGLTCVRACSFISFFFSFFFSFAPLAVISSLQHCYVEPIREAMRPAAAVGAAAPPPMSDTNFRLLFTDISALVGLHRDLHAQLAACGTDVAAAVAVFIARLPHLHSYVPYEEGDREGRAGKRAERVVVCIIGMR